MWVFLSLLLLALVNSNAEYMTKKFCKDVNQDLCSVYTLQVDPCEQGPAYCNIKAGKKYALTLNLSPKFSAEKLKLAINGDVKNDGRFLNSIQAPKDGCGYLTCPLIAEERRIFDVDLSIDKTLSGKFPVQVKLWNEANQTQACCFTFNIKVK